MAASLTLPEIATRPSRPLSVSAVSSRDGRRVMNRIHDSIHAKKKKDLSWTRIGLLTVMNALSTPFFSRRCPPDVRRREGHLGDHSRLRLRCLRLPPSDSRKLDLDLRGRAPRDPLTCAFFYYVIRDNKKKKRNDFFSFFSCSLP